MGLKKYRPYMYLADLEHMSDVVNKHTPEHPSARYIRRFVEDCKHGLRTEGHDIVGRSVVEKLAVDFAVDEVKEIRKETKDEAAEKAKFEMEQQERYINNEMTEEEEFEYKKSIGAIFDNPP